MLLLLSLFFIFWSFPSSQNAGYCLVCFSEICFFSDPSCSPGIAKVLILVCTTTMDGNRIASSVLHVALHLVYINIIIAGGYNNISFCLYLFVYISTINQSNRVTICTGVTSQLIVILTGLRDAEMDQRGPFLPLCIVYCVIVSLCHCSCLLAVCVSLCLYNPKYPLFDSYREIITMTILSPEYEYPYEIINHGGFDPQIGENLPRYFPSPFSSVLHTPHYH